MACIKDLDLRVREPRPGEPQEPAMRAVGWLGSTLEAVGPTSPAFQARLGRLAQKPFPGRRMSDYPCLLCPRSERASRDPLVARGWGELRVGGPKATYVAPVLIVHYVLAHGYCPPDAFIEAVMASVAEPTEAELEAVGREAQLQRGTLEEARLSQRLRLASAQREAEADDRSGATEIRRILEALLPDPMRRGLERGGATVQDLEQLSRKVLSGLPVPDLLKVWFGGVNGQHGLLRVSSGDEWALLPATSAVSCWKTLCGQATPPWKRSWIPLLRREGAFLVLALAPRAHDGPILEYRPGADACERFPGLLGLARALLAQDARNV